MKRVRTDALCAAACMTLILGLGCAGSATLSDFLGADLTNLLTNQLGESNSSGADDQSQSDDPVGHDVGDDNGGDRDRDVSDDPPGDDSGGDRHDGSGDNDNPPSGDLRIVADLSGATAAKGKAEFRHEAGRRKFKIEVEDFPAGIYDVFLNEVKVTEIEVGTAGIAEIEFDSKVEPGHVAFPSEFPESVKAGDTIRIGDILKGVF